MANEASPVCPERATLMLSAGAPAHVIQRRLGHAKIEMTLGIGDALPSMQAGGCSKAGSTAPRVAVTTKANFESFQLCP